MKALANEWTLDGFVEHFGFVHESMLDHKYAWILGAGASYASGIPLGSELTDRWLNEIHLREDGGKIPLAQWATAEKLEIENFVFSERASFYPRIYQRRFRNYPEEGYAYLESVMSGKDPSPGYSILAAALAMNPPRHNVVITTNFDSLVADALSIYTDTFPFVCGHESLTAFVRVAMRRPLICKIHRDLLLGPQNDPRSLRRLHDAWGTALRSLFQHYTPLFIGYGGNDDTLMDLLESLQAGDIKGQMIWCYYEGGKPSQRITNVVADLKGVLVPIPDFDSLMLVLGEKMRLGLREEEITRRADERKQRYLDRIMRLDTIKHPAVMKALGATFETTGGWWGWYQKAEAEAEPERRETVYRQGLQHFPKSSELYGNFAAFLEEVPDKQDEAEEMYKKAIDLDPKNAIARTNFANFTWRVRQKYDEAEAEYRKALGLDPKNVGIAFSFAMFLRNRRKFDEAEARYRQALEAAPSDPMISASLADFLTSVRHKHDEAELLYRKALELDPSNADNTGSFASFLTDVRGNHDEAGLLYQKALELAPKNLINVTNYAEFLLTRNRHEEATQMLELARSLNGDHANQLAVILFFYEEILACARHEDDTELIIELGRRLSQGFRREPYIFKQVLAFVKDKLPPQDQDFLSVLAEAIQDEKRVTAATLQLRRRLNAVKAAQNSKKARKRSTLLKSGNGKVSTKKSAPRKGLAHAHAAGRRRQILGKN